jgi:hypothetical protein
VVSIQLPSTAEESGWSGGGSPLWASALGADRIAYAMPGDLQTLKFHFPVIEELERR